METLEAIRKRCSLKTHLSGKELPWDMVETVLEAGRVAPSARNSQPWRFVVVQGKETVESLVNAAFFETGADARQASVLILICANPRDDMSLGGKDYYLFDAGMAVQNMLLAATDLGLATHTMISYDEAKVKKRLNIPDDVRIVAATPLAYPLESSYDKASKERLSQRTRNDLKDIAYLNKWGEAVK